MEHYIRIAFWIFALFACLPQGNPVPLIIVNDWNVKDLKKVECHDSTFYTPTNVKSECFIAALNCTIAELNGTALQECTKNVHFIPWGLNTLNHVVSKLKENNNPTMGNSADCNCHTWHERPFNDFVDTVNSLLEEINANPQPKKNGGLFALLLGSSPEKHRKKSEAAAKQEIMDS